MAARWRWRARWSRFGAYQADIFRGALYVAHCADATAAAAAGPEATNGSETTTTTRGAALACDTFARLIPDDREVDNVGWAVAVDAAGTVAVGAPRQNNGIGAVYVYRCDADARTCAAVDKIVHPRPRPDDRVGTSVAASEGRVVVGAPGVDGGYGAAFVYDCRAACALVATLEPDPADSTTEPAFGVGVAIYGPNVLVGAPGTDRQVGAAYYYACDWATATCTSVAILKALDGGQNDVFGRAVAFWGTQAVVGAYGKDSLRGAAYAFNCTPAGGCVQVAKLEALTGVPGDCFGFAVAVWGPRIIVGAYNTGSQVGSAHFFECDDFPRCFDYAAVTVPPGTITPAYLGYSVGIANTTAIAGAMLQELDNGAAYVYTL